jgi:hypothetical protein
MAVVRLLSRLKPTDKAGANDAEKMFGQVEPGIEALYCALYCISEA